MRITSSDLLLQVVRLFGVERAGSASAISRSGTTSAVIALRAQPAHRFEAVAAVRRPEALLRRRDGDDRVEETAGLLDDVGQPLMVHFGDVALERRRLDPVDREGDQHHRVAAQRVAVSGEHAAVRALDFSGYRRQFVRKSDAAFLRLQAGGLGRPFAPGRALHLRFCFTRHLLLLSARESPAATTAVLVPLSRPGVLAGFFLPTSSRTGPLHRPDTYRPQARPSGSESWT